MLTEMWEETGVKPATLVNRPTLLERWNIPYKVWIEISGSRNYTAGGPAEIPFSEFFLWAYAHNYERLEMELMWEDVHAIDKVWLNETGERAKAEREAAARKAKK